MVGWLTDWGKRIPATAQDHAHGDSGKQMPARPLTVDEIRLIVGGIDRSLPIGIRDAAIILLGYASSMRRSEIVALTLADVEHKPAGLLLRIRQSKMDQEGHGQVVPVAHGQHASTDPWQHLLPGVPCEGRCPAHCSPGSGGDRSASNHCRGTSWPGCSAPAPRPPDSMAPGSPPTPYALATPPPQHSPASLSIGSRPRPRYKDLAVLVNRYICPLEALATTSSRDIGL